MIVGAGWPILVLSRRPGWARAGVAHLSPVVAVYTLIEVLIERRQFGHYAHWWITFWDIECLALALGLLWLTVRTFDRQFDRVPDRPGRAPVLADVVMVLAGLIGIGSLIGGIGVWVQGTSHVMPTADLQIWAHIESVAVGFALLAALAASSMSPAATSPAAAPVSAAAISDRKSFAIRWWEAFRLVLLLAIGPALVALALATAPKAFEVAKNVKLLPGGGSVRIQTNWGGDTYVTTTDASGRATYRLATDAEIAEAGPAPTQTRGALLQVAALATVTVLVHGAAFVSLGLATRTVGRRSRRDRPAEADAEIASLQPARGECGSAAI